jgi:hypothetical protein
MSKRDEYLANAAECQRMAHRTRNESERKTWQEMAESWLHLAAGHGADSRRSGADRSTME